MRPGDLSNKIKSEEVCQTDTVIPSRQWLKFKRIGALEKEISFELVHIFTFAMLPIFILEFWSETKVN